MADQRVTRQKRLAAIHAAKRDLAMDEDIYRQMLREVAGVESARDLDTRGLRSVLARMQQLGWDKRPRRRVAQHPSTPHNIDSVSMLQKIEAQLADMGLPWAYADAIAKRQTGIERVAWVSKTRQLSAIIAALHVEAEKRSLLTTADGLLSAVGLSQEQAAEKFGLATTWRRNRPALKRLITSLEGLICRD